MAEWFSYVVCSSILTDSYDSIERELSFRISINNETLRISFIPNKYGIKKMGNSVVGNKNGAAVQKWAHRLKKTYSQRNK